MTPEQFDELKMTVANTMRETVNGKIDKLQRAFDEHAKEDREWKESAQPAIDVVNNARGFGKTAMYVLGVGAALFAFIKGFMEVKK